MWRRRRSWALEAPVGPVELVALSSQEATTCCTHPCPVFEYPGTPLPCIPVVQYSSTGEPQFFQFSWLPSPRNPPLSSMHKLLHTNTLGYLVPSAREPSTKYELFVYPSSSPSLMLMLSFNPALAWLQVN